MVEHDSWTRSPGRNEVSEPVSIPCLLIGPRPNRECGISIAVVWRPHPALLRSTLSHLRPEPREMLGLHDQARPHLDRDRLLFDSSRESPSKVLDERDRLQVLGPNAAPVPAYVVKDQIFRNRSDEELVDRSVRRNVPAAFRNPPITTSVRSADPRPAFFCPVNLRKKSALEKRNSGLSGFKPVRWTHTSNRTADPSQPGLRARPFRAVASTR